ncbi:MAG: LysM peptidoglycan-binding domain-containing protein [Chloroflexi bacterium]|nr:LysM peptidoglycan-binding domain-containing protein [Chloroflexota bacterium]
MSKLRIVLVAVLMGVFLVACGGGDDADDSAEESPTVIVSPTAGTPVAEGAVAESPTAATPAAGEAVTETPPPVIPPDTITTDDTRTPSHTPGPTEPPPPTHTPTATFTPTQTPTFTATPCALRTDWTLYIVRDGDTLSNLARRTNTTIDALVGGNCLAGPGPLIPGQDFYVPEFPASAGPVLDEAALDTPLVMLLDGDLWAWSANSADLTQITQSGYASRPLLAPDGSHIAYRQWASITLDAIASGQDLRGLYPSDIRLWALDSGAIVTIAAQPDGARFMSEDVDNAVIRSAPAWSPDGTQLVWAELVLPAYNLHQVQLVVYDLDSEETTVIMPQLDLTPSGFGQVALPALAWDTNGIAVLDTVDGTVWIFASDGERVFVHTHQGPVRVMVWAADVAGAQGALALLDATGTWTLLDPVAGTMLPVLEPLALTGAEDAAVVRIEGVDGERLVWSVAGEIVDFTGEPDALALEPGGESIAWVTGSEDGVVVWQDGDQVIIPNTAAPGDQPGGLAWGAGTWRVPDTTAAPGDECPLPPRLAVDAQGIVLPAFELPLAESAGAADPDAETLPPGQVFDVVDGPECVDGALWWEVSADETGGWLAANQARAYTVQPYAPAVCEEPPLFVVGQTGRAAIGPPLPLRIDPDPTSALTGQLPGGTVFSVQDGPACVDGVDWWQITAGGQFGWVAESGYRLQAFQCPASLPPRLMPGAPAVVIAEEEIAFFLGRPNGGDLPAIPPGSLVSVLSGPQCGSDGYLWWEVQYDDLPGWVIESTEDGYLLELLQG